MSVGVVYDDPLEDDPAIDAAFAALALSTAEAKRARVDLDREAEKLAWVLERAGDVAETLLLAAAGAAAAEGAPPLAVGMAHEVARKAVEAAIQEAGKRAGAKG